MNGKDPTQYQWRPTDDLPWFINLCVTSRCNLRCVSCRAGIHPVQEPPFDELLVFLDRLAGWLPKPRRVILTGGEPLLHPRIEDIIARLGHLSFLPALNTNGSLLNASLVDRLNALRPILINLSLDGIGQTHDRLRNGPGLYQGVMDILQYLSRHSDLTLSVVTTINRLNADEIPDLAKRLADNPRLHAHRFQAVTPTLWQPWSDEFFATSPLWPRDPADQRKILATLDSLAELQSQGYPIDNHRSQFECWREYFSDPLGFLDRQPCPLANDNLIVLADGSVTLCDHCGIIGKIDEEPSALWSGERAERMRGQMRLCRQPCIYRINCSFTPPPNV